VTQDLDDESKFHVVEVFKSSAAFRAHQSRASESEWAEVTRDCPRDYVMAGLN
jgi:quinol monooxygenase YgiN